jgi:hypothetical protein
MSVRFGEVLRDIRRGEPRSPWFLSQSNNAYPGPSCASSNPVRLEDTAWASIITAERQALSVAPGIR